MPIFNHSSETMPELLDNSVACIITSPPYPMIAKWDDIFNLQQAPTFTLQHEILYRVWSECYKKLIPGGILCVNIGDATRTVDKNFVCYPNYAKATIDLLNIGFNPLIPIFWRKISNRPNAFLGSGFLPVNAYVSQDCEYIGIYRKGNLRKFSVEEKEKRQASKFTKEERDIWFSQLWNIQGEKGAKKHSGWPEAIFYRLMRMYSIIGDTIVDPFCGRGNEVLCEKYDRKYIGYDLSENPGE